MIIKSGIRWLKRRTKKQWLIAATIAVFMVLAMPLVAGAVTSTDALAGLNDTLVKMVDALVETLKAMVELFEAYLGAL